MAKGMCISGMAIAALILLVFLTDFAASMAGLAWLAPFQGANPAMDVVFSLCAAALGYLSWSTWKEQV